MEVEFVREVEPLTGASGSTENEELMQRPNIVKFNSIRGDDLQRTGKEKLY